MGKKISVIVPTYNVEKYIERCLNSIIRQNIDDMEIIIVDDASTDDTCQIIYRNFANDERIIFIQHERNRGLGCARNTGIKNACGEFIFFVDSDDWISDNTLMKLYNIAVNEKTDIVACGIRLVFEDGKMQTYHADEVQTAGNIIGLNALLSGKISVTAWNKLYRKDLFTRHNLSFPPVYHEDMIFAIEAMYHCKSFISISDELYNYYQSPQSITRSLIGEKHIYSYFAILKLINDFIVKNDLKDQDDIVKNIYRNQVNWTIYNMKKFYNQTKSAERDSILYDVLAEQFGDNNHLMKELFDNIMMLNDKLSKFLNPKNLLLKLKEKKIVFFGSGSASKKILDDYPLRVEYFVDNNPAKWGENVGIVEIYNPKRLLSEYKDRIAIIVASQYYNEIAEQLKKMGFEENIHFWDGYEIFTIGKRAIL